MKAEHSEKKMLKLIWQKSRSAAIVVLVITILGAIAEAVSLAIVPLLMSSSLGQQRSAAGRFDIASSLPRSESEFMMLYALIGFVFIFCLKTFFLTVVVWVQSKFIYNVKMIISRNILEIYLDEDYEQSLSIESSKKVSNLTIEMHAFVVNFLFPCISLLTEFLVVVAMVFVAVLMEPIAAATAIVILGLSMFLLDRFTRTRLTKWGLQRAEGEAGKVQTAQQAFDSFKEIKIASSYQHFGDLFADRLGVTREVETKELALSQMPRLWLEAIAVVSLAAVLIVSVASGGKVSDSIATTGLFALMAFRLMPSANRIIVALQKIRYSHSTLSLLLSLLQRPLRQIVERSDTRFNRRWGELSFNRVSFRYSANPSHCLQDISFNLKRGECLGIVGPSGVGKSTLLDIALSLLHPQDGAVFVDNTPLVSVEADWRKSIGYVPQSPLLLSGTIASNVAFGLPANEIDFKKVDEALQAAGLAEFAGQQAKIRHIGERGNSLSGGQRQRISIARALYGDPDIIFFDEATSSLDTASGLDVVSTIEKLKGQKTIVIVTHHQYPLRVCDRILKLDKDGIREIKQEKASENETQASD